MEKLILDTKDCSSWAGMLRAGDEVLLSGTVYTARDAAHKRITEIIVNGGTSPFDLENAAVYYAGPTPAKPGMAAGSIGPTTSSRMDMYTPRLIGLGLKVMIGKGGRSPEVIEAMKRFGAVYLCAIGGAGALASKSIVSLEVTAFEDLGCESVKKLTFKDFPLICGIDSTGGSLFK